MQTLRFYIVDHYAQPRAIYKGLLNEYIDNREELKCCLGKKYLIIEGLETCHIFRRAR